ncbi:alkaline phosphatase D family protein [Sabulicella glaciei]|uniref:Alkaline phosphatase D family protein n=1 Tax=Sabulicella glaciei TaxID=2984948 RepID=A0ABT3NTJ1_9PROT|nr:alkaline phosphatase D family protein [Roseococcus sp. MDT2-1-1]MCW8085475.1 alkaline phosphatase D family protein [Roseococcus sp. MDT2-1-1]
MLPRRFVLALPALVLGTPRSAPASGPIFTLGVASGEPRPDSLVLWTRLAPLPLEPDGGMGAAPAELGWELAEDEGFQRIHRSGRVTATADEAHSVHLELDGLPPGRSFFFRFHARGEASPVGRTRTAPAPEHDGPVRFLAGGCQNWEHGVFTAWAHAAREPDIAFVFHYGDSIYERAGRLPGASGVPVVRSHQGGDCLTLADYRIRHAQYRTDPDLQSLHAAHPVIASYDDHEVENNWAGDHSQQDGSRRFPRLVTPEEFAPRRAAGQQAWWEHMPVARAARDGAYRRFRFGRTLALHVLDTRRFRDDQPCGDGGQTPCPAAFNPQAQMLGAAQEAWLREGLSHANARWQVLAQQIFLSQRILAGDRRSMDSWDGYPAARERLLAMLRGRDCAVLTGDVHRAWAGDVAAEPGGAPVAAEFVATSITSEGDGSDMQRGAAEILSRNPWLRFHSNHRGYTRHEACGDVLEARFMAVPFVSRPGAPLLEAGRRVALAGRPGVVPG